MTIFYIKRFDGKPSIQISVKTIKVNDIRFKGKRSINWKDVKEYLKEYVGDFYKIASTGDVIYIGSDLPSEYSGSKYTNSLKGANSKAMANAASGLPEMIEIAVGKHFRINQEMKHKRDAKNGWYRYDSRFALPVYGNNREIERYNIFHASMLIRHSNDEKLYLYDIIDIKKNEQLSRRIIAYQTKNPFLLWLDNTIGYKKCQSEYSN